MHLCVIFFKIVFFFFLLTDGKNRNNHCGSEQARSHGVLRAAPAANLSYFYKYDSRTVSTPSTMTFARPHESSRTPCIQV